MEHLVISERQNAVVTEGQGTIVSYNYAQGRKAPLTDELRRRITAARSGGGALVLRQRLSNCLEFSKL